MSTLRDTNALLASVIALPLDRRASVLRAQGYPPCIYKYRALDPNDDTSVGRMRALIVDSALWLSSPAHFNDPFDMRASVSVVGHRSEITKRLQTLAQGSDMRSDECARLISDLMSNDDSGLRGTIEHRARALINGNGVFSAGVDPLNILMWSHYGASHTGFCVGFEVARSPDPLMRALRVRYASEAPLIRWDGQVNREDVGNALLTKASAWSYEEERRIIDLGAADSAIHLPEDGLGEVIVGCKAPDATVQSIRTALRDRVDQTKREVPLYRAVRHNTRYALQRQAI